MVNPSDNAIHFTYATNFTRIKNSKCGLSPNPRLLKPDINF